MPSWIRTSLWLVIVGITLLWLTPAYRCVKNHFVETERTDQIKRTLSPESVHAELDKIEARNGTGMAITVTQQAKDVSRMEFLRANVKKFQPGGDGAIQRVNVLCKLMYDKALQAQLDDEIRMELRRLRKGHEPEPIAWTSVGHSLLNFMLWYLCFTPLALLILFMRVTAWERSVAWAVAALRRKPGELIAALLFWPIGLFEYREQTPLPEQVREVAEALDRLRIRNPKRSITWHRMEEAFFFRSIMPSFGLNLWLPCWITSCFRLAGMVFQYIWGSPDWSWCRLVVAVFRYPRLVRRAVYVTLTTMTCIIIGNVPMTMAAESAGKEEKPRDPVVRGAMLQFVDQPGGNTGTASVLLFLKGFSGGDIEVDVFGYNKPDPVLEVSHVFPLPIKGLSWKSGPFVDLVNDQVIAYGVYSLVFSKVGSGTIGGPLYFSWTPKGELTCYTPHLFGFWGINGSRRWQAGFDSVISVTEGKQPNVLVGPAIQYKPTVRDRIFVGWGQWLSGAMSGNRWRVEWGHAF